MALFGVGDRVRPRARRLDNPGLADKMVRRDISRTEIDTLLANNEIVEVYEHEGRVRYVLLGHSNARPLHVVVAEDDVVGPPSYSRFTNLTKPTVGMPQAGSASARRSRMARDVHHDGGRLRRTTVAHRHVVDREDGTVSAIVVRGVPALVCDLCEETYYETDTTGAVVRLLNDTDVAPGQAVAVDYAAIDAA